MVACFLFGDVLRKWTGASTATGGLGKSKDSGGDGHKSAVLITRGAIKRQEADREWSCFVIRLGWGETEMPYGSQVRPSKSEDTS